MLVAEGLPNSEVAARLGISRNTVMVHLESAHRKAGTGGNDGSDRVRLAAWLRQGEPKPEPGRRGASALTAKQAETALLSAAGVPRREIAAKLGVSESVVGVRLRAVYAKAGTDGGAGARERLAAWLREQGMLP